MNIRLIILLVLLAGSIVFLVVRKPAASASKDADQGALEGISLNPDEERVIREGQTPYSDRPLSGEEPPIPPEFSVQISVNRASGKNQLCAAISESHGYFVESLKLEAWWAGDDGSVKPEQSPLVVPQYINRFIKANDTLRYCFEIVPAELKDVGGDIGSDINWAGRITWHSRARLNNPEPMWE